MTGFDGSELGNGVGNNYCGVPAAGLAWLMFTQTGMPGLYMLYSDLERGEIRTPFD